MSIYEKLSSIQSELIAPKGQYNSFGKYSYRSCEDILEAVKPFLNKLNVAITISDEILQIGDRYYIKATAKIIDCESGEHMKNSAFAREEESKKGMDASQVTGSASSYARKYALNGLLCIDDVKDADTRDNTKSRTKKSSSDNSAYDMPYAPPSEKDTKISEQMVRTIKAQVEKYNSKGLRIEKILSIYKVKDISEMTIADFKDCMNKFKLYDDGGVA